MRLWEEGEDEEVDEDGREALWWYRWRYESSSTSTSPHGPNETRCEVLSGILVFTADVIPAVKKINRVHYEGDYGHDSNTTEMFMTDFTKLTTCLNIYTKHRLDNGHMKVIKYIIKKNVVRVVIKMIKCNNVIYNIIL